MLQSAMLGFIACLQLCILTCLSILDWEPAAIKLGGMLGSRIRFLSQLEPKRTLVEKPLLALLS